MDSTLRGLKSESPSCLDPVAQVGHQFGLLAQGGPEHAVGEPVLHLRVVGQGGGEGRLADAPHALEAQRARTPGSVGPAGSRRALRSRVTSGRGTKCTGNGGAWTILGRR